MSSLQLDAIAWYEGNDALTEEIIGFEKKYLRVYPDSEPALKELVEKGLRVWIISENGERHTRLRLIRTGLINYITGVIGSDTYGGPKKTLLPYVNMLRDLKLSPDDLAMVGDSLENDIEAAYREGLKNIFHIDRNKRMDIRLLERYYEINSLLVLPKILSR